MIKCFAILLLDGDAIPLVRAPRRSRVKYHSITNSGDATGIRSMHSASQWACATPLRESRGLVMQLIKWVVARLRLETGATMVEYGLMVALIAVVALLAVTALGGSVRDIFQNVADTLTP